MVVVLMGSAPFVFGLFVLYSAWLTRNSDWGSCMLAGLSLFVVVCVVCLVSLFAVSSLLSDNVSGQMVHNHPLYRRCDHTTFAHSLLVFSHSDRTTVH